MDYRNYITIEPNKRGGKPCVRGLRITVYEVLEYLASEMTEAEILDDLALPDLWLKLYWMIHFAFLAFAEGLAVPRY